MKSIGGYFGLELSQKEEYHKDATRLNTGRNALEYVLKARQYDKVYIPYYTCEVVLEPINKLNIEYEFYSINERFEPGLSIIDGIMFNSVEEINRMLDKYSLV